MKKRYKATQFLSAEFKQELTKVALPYRGNLLPIRSTLNALNSAPLNCKTVIFEWDYVDKDYQDEFAAFYSHAFKRYPSRAVRLHFFAADLADNDISRIDAFSDKYLGFLVLRPTDLQRVGRTILTPTLKDPDKEFIHCRAAFSAHILGHTLSVQSMPFIQQDTQVGACAQASLWMLARYMSRRFGHREFLPAEINQMAKAKGSMGRVFPAELGLNWKQMLDALDAMGFPAWSYSELQFDDCSNHIDTALSEPANLSDDQKKAHHKMVRKVKLADIAYRYIESGLPVIFGTCDHALVGIGHTYDHSAQTSAAILRIHDFIVHNDATGPYQSMPISQSNKGNRSFLDVEDIIAVVPPEVTLRGEAAEAMARQAVATFLAQKTDDAGFPTYKDLIAAVRSDLHTVLDKLEYRTFLMPSVEFQAKLRQDIAGKIPRFNVILGEELVALDYPKFIWITEVSSSALLNQPQRGQRKCLGRVVIDSTAPARTRGEMIVHFADFLGMLDRQTGQAQPWRYVPNTTPFGHQISS